MQSSSKAHEIIAMALEICDQRNLRLTNLRKRILEIISTADQPIKAYTLLAILQQEKANAQPPTVYRALNFLLENKLIHKVPSQNAYICCKHAHINHDCYFFICEQCGSLTEYCSDNLTAEIDKMITKQYCTRTKINIEIYGNCRVCANNK